MARLEVYLSDDLRERIDKVWDQVNWSQVAARAFETELAAIAARKGKKTMKDVVQRLRASKLASDDAETNKGFTAGQRWAQTAADWAQLKAVASLDEDRFEEEDSELVRQGFAVIGIWEVSTAILRPRLGGDDPNWTDVHHFWKEDFDEETIPSVAYLQGFVQGAREVFEQVEDEV